MSPITLDPAQCAALLRHFEAVGRANAHQHGWSRRAYAPQLIRTPELASVLAALEAAHPEHVVAFDVLFEAQAGVAVDWHVDYESLGPFVVASPWRAVREGHFRTVHFNLTPEGGALTTFASPWLSWVYYRVISAWGIYGRAHRLLNAACRPLFRLGGRAHPAAPGVGNAFNNARLHAVGAGERRVSYVVRLVHKSVPVSRAAVFRAVQRSPACAVFTALLPGLTAGATPAGAVDWGEVKCAT